MQHKLVDLSAFYTNGLDDEMHHKPGNDLSAVPHGINEFAGTVFKVGGVLQLSGSVSKEKSGLDFAPQVTGIGIYRSGSQVHFLHGASWHGEDGLTIGEYRIHYADGGYETIPIRYGRDVVDWWFMPGDTPPTDSRIAWSGQNERTRNLDSTVQFYASTWVSPRPHAHMTELDFISAGVESAPFLMAVTVE